MQSIERIIMHTELIDGAGVPGFDKIIAPWLHRVRRVPTDDTVVWNIGIRNNVQQVYRKITVYRARQQVDLLSHFDANGFTPVSFEFAKKSGFDCVFCYEKWQQIEPARLSQQCLELAMLFGVRNLRMKNSQIILRMLI